MTFLVHFFISNFISIFKKTKPGFFFPLIFICEWIFTFESMCFGETLCEGTCAGNA